MTNLHIKTSASWNASRSRSLDGREGERDTTDHLDPFSIHVHPFQWSIDKHVQGGILYDAHPGGWTYPSHNSYLAPWVLPWTQIKPVQTKLTRTDEHGHANSQSFALTLFLEHQGSSWSKLDCSHIFMVPLWLGSLPRFDTSAPCSAAMGGEVQYVISKWNLERRKQLQYVAPLQGSQIPNCSRFFKVDEFKLKQNTCSHGTIWNRFLLLRLLLIALRHYLHTQNTQRPISMVRTLQSPRWIKHFPILSSSQQEDLAFGYGNPNGISKSLGVQDEGAQSHPPCCLHAQHLMDLAAEHGTFDQQKAMSNAPNESK